MGCVRLGGKREGTLKADHPMLHEGDSRGGGDAYTHRREKTWRHMGITFEGKPLKWAVFIKCVELQKHCCAICGMNDALESLSADHKHGCDKKRSGEFRGALCHHCNHRATGVVEKFGHYRNERYTALIVAYLTTPPAMRFRKELHEVNK
jgi:hypothetical protein